MLRIVALFGLILYASGAHAFCDGFHPVPEFYVGDTNPASPTYDVKCTHSDIQTAITAATCSYGTNIFITHEHTYTGQSLSIQDRNVTLIGRIGGDKCGPAIIVICDPIIGCAPPPTGPLVIVGGTNNASVITINGTSHVTLRYLDITNVGNNANGNGGGIDFDGSGTLTIDTSWVGNSHATNGGGIYFNGTGAATSTLNVLAHSDIFNNTADGDGGGILVAGNAVLNMLEPDTEINTNHALGGNGGGVAVIGPATANIGSPGVSGPEGQIGVVTNNDAAYGGGLAVLGGSNDGDSATLRLFTTDASQPVAIVSNKATNTGGGIYLKPHAQGIPSIIAHASAYAWDYRIEDNIAAEGAAIYADVDTSFDQSLAGDVWLGNTLAIGGGFPTSLGAVACTNSVICNTINLNQTTDQTSGSIILIQDTGYLVANRFSMRGNKAGSAIHIVGDQVLTYLFNCLFAENTTQNELIYVSGSDTPTILNSCTFANDAIGGSHVIHAESSLTLTDSIIDEAGTLALDYSGNPADLSINYMLANDVSTLPDSAGTGIALGTPDFVDLANGDYHLKPTSLGVDYAPTSGAAYVSNSTDLDGNTRNVDLPSAGNVFGSQDLGAYEVQNLFRECGTKDSIYCDGFEH